MAENFDVFGFELTPDEMAAIDALDQGKRVGSDPDTGAVLDAPELHALAARGRRRAGR